jgi:hypothetical protein
MVSFYEKQLRGRAHVYRLPTGRRDPRIVLPWRSDTRIKRNWKQKYMFFLHLSNYLDDYCGINTETQQIL